MIRLAELAEAGIFNKPHGIKGEISATLDIDIDLSDVKCIVVSIDGIFVPFFINKVRPKTADTCLLTIEGIQSEAEAQNLTNRTLYVLRNDLPEDDKDDDDGFYASDLIGFHINDINAGNIGIIADINDSTQNILFIIKTDSGKELLIPVADEFILSIDAENQSIETDIPSGILTLND